jgi:peptidoglycan/LPS O-acetylase OafA/YrhL
MAGISPDPVRCGRLLDELKGVAIACIVLYHCAGVFSEQEDGFAFGRFGVDLFLIRSGVGLTFLGKPSTPVDFLRRRFWRIAPSSWFAYTAYLLAGWVILREGYPAAHIVIHYLGLQSAFGPMGFEVAPAFWFITLLVYLYPILAFTTRWHHRLDLVVLTGCAATVAAGTWYRWVVPNESQMIYVAYRVPSFFLGIVGGQFLRNGCMSYRVSWWQGMVIALVAVRWSQFTLQADSMLYGVAIAAAYVLVIRAACRSWGLTALPRFCGFLGRRSLEIFDLH